MTNIRYADIKDYLGAIMKVENRPISGWPHGVWWNISYDDFTAGQGSPRCGAHDPDHGHPESVEIGFLRDPD